jgi:hypothetical protein
VPSVRRRCRPPSPSDAITCFAKTAWQSGECARDLKRRFIVQEAYRVTASDDDVRNLVKVLLSLCFVMQVIEINLVLGPDHTLEEWWFFCQRLLFR